MATPADEPDYEYIAYIDEAGDPGIERVRPIDPAGGTEWLVLGAFLIRKKRDQETVQFVQRLINDLNLRQRVDLHFRHLTPARKLAACQALASFPARLFALASNKKNMRGHRNERAARVSGPISSSQYMYNYCARLLLERITDYVENHSIAEFGTPRKLKIVFSERGGVTYGQTAAYTEILKNQARAGTTFLKKREIKWSVIDHRLVRPAPHGQLAGLQVADIVASAFYQAVDVLDVQNDPRFAAALKPIMAREKGSIVDYGLCLQPQTWKAKLLPVQQQIFREYGYKF